MTTAVAAAVAADLTARLEAVRSAGRFEARALDALRAFLTDAPDEDLFRTSPLRLAERYDLDEHTAIDLVLHATRAGVFDFDWGVLCPGCAAFLTTRGGLRSLAVAKHCGFCRIDAQGSVDDNVEVAFTVNPAVRRLRFHDPDTLNARGDVLTMLFSRSLRYGQVLHEPLQSLIVDVWRLPRGDTPDVHPITLAAGRYVLIAPASHSVLHLTVRDGTGAPAALAVDLLDGAFIPEDVEVAAGAVSLQVRNRTNVAAHLLLAGDPWPTREQMATMTPYPQDLRPFFTGKRLITSQAFRELFRAESIPADEGLQVKNLTVLFTDLKGSTEMYERIGDLQAFALVRRHFDLLRGIVAERGGAVVKTIGDAIMASFAEPAPALEAAAVMNREIRQVSHAGGRADLLLKVGLHAGACIAVELNERLDYFGQTVNLAARVQGFAGAGEIVCTDAVWNAPGAAAVARAASLSATRDEARLKGIGAAVPVVRLS
jgi:class 3 adenylate cyclase